MIKLCLLFTTGLGCGFLTEPCTNQSVFPYLCNTSATQLLCTYDHLSKVCFTDNVLLNDNIIDVIG